MAAVAVCSICMDENERIAFECRTVDCGYQMCQPCLKEVLVDSTVTNSKYCPMCKESTGVRMVEAMAGKGAVRLVEHELRASVEYHVKSDYLKKNQDKKELDSLATRARTIFHELSEELTMKCPRCSTAFYDYDGCNALCCSQVACGAAFCAICLQDCGSDAHQHVHERHGTLFGKSAFEQGRIAREKIAVQRCLDELSKERFELKQMVQNQIERAKLGESKSSNKAHLMTTFIAESRIALEHACNSDRLSILRDPEDRNCFRQGLSRADISPRLVIPDEYRVRLTRSRDMVYTLQVTKEDENGVWRRVSLDKLTELTPAVDALTNIKQAIQCGVIAFEQEHRLYQSQVVRPPKGVRLKEDEISVALFAVDQKGNVSAEESANAFNLEVVGVNQNLRMIKLSKHVAETDVDKLAFEPLEHLVGVTSPKPILEELHSPPPVTINLLNKEQKSVAHPLCLKTAIEVAGPPGSGKTKTITELVRALLECTTKNIVVMSERNGAIDAIAEKFATACLDTSGRNPRITDLNLWNNIMTFGASTVGPSTQLFTLEAKLRYHPELLLLKKEFEERRSAQSALARQMRDAVAVALSDTMKPFRTLNASRISDTLGKELKHPCSTISSLVGVKAGIQHLLRRASRMQEDDVVDLVEHNPALLSSLSLDRSQHEQARTKWDRDGSIAKLKAILNKLSDLLATPIFNEEDAQSIQSSIREIEEQSRRAEERLSRELPLTARLRMSTIGSSHKLLGNVTMEAYSSDDEDIAVDFDQLKLAESDEKAIVIFDEAGCIPAYELLGLTRLDSTVEALVLVGDKKQLPPYQSSASFSSSRRSSQNGRYGSNCGRDSTRKRQPVVKSLLDCSRLSLDSGERLKLTIQYRVPRDIAGILNDRVYSGDYKTAPNCEAPARGLRFVGVRPDPEPRRKYVNKFEVDEVLDIIFRHQGEQVMVVTPYKNQQREIQFQLKRLDIDDHKVLTIDQCQGQEADTVILSLVQKPTRFLNKNRFNVALSRVRQTLYFLTDKREFRKAAMNNDWDCHLMAKDLLELWDEYE